MAPKQPQHLQNVAWHSFQILRRCQWEWWLAEEEEEGREGAALHMLRSNWTWSLNTCSCHVGGKNTVSLGTGWLSALPSTTVFISQALAWDESANRVMASTYWYTQLVQVSIFQIPILKCETLFLLLAPLLIVKVDVCALERQTQEMSVNDKINTRYSIPYNDHILMSYSLYMVAEAA